MKQGLLLVVVALCIVGVKLVESQATFPSQTTCDGQIPASNYWTYPFVLCSNNNGTCSGDGYYQKRLLVSVRTDQNTVFRPQDLEGLTGLTVFVTWRLNATVCATNNDASASAQVTFTFDTISMNVRNDSTILPRVQQWTSGRRLLPEVTLVSPSLPAGGHGCFDVSSSPSNRNPQGNFTQELNYTQSLQFFTGANYRFITAFQYSASYTSTSGGYLVEVQEMSIFVNITLYPHYNRLRVRKFTEDIHYASTPGYPHLTGNPVHWRYDVTNAGTNLLSDIVVSDNRGVAVTCPKATLDVCEAMSCTATGVAGVGQYDNTASSVGHGTVTLSGPVGVGPIGTTDVVSNNDTSYYFGYRPRLALLSLTNDVDIRPSGVPNVGGGMPVTWKYVVTNTGTCTMANVSVTDNRPGVWPVCPPTPLPAAGSMVCSVVGTAQSSGRYDNVGSASGYCQEVVPPYPAALATAFAVNETAYFGISQSIRIVSYTNDYNLQTNGRPFVRLSDPVTWKYAVTNTGNSVLSTVTVTDSVFAGPITCPLTSLAAGETQTCSAVSTALQGLYDNVGSASGVSLAAVTVTDHNSTGYFGVVQRLSLNKLTNLVDIRNPGASAVPPPIGLSAPVTWDYVVTNLGNTDLSNVAVRDDHLAASAVHCPATILASLSVMTCSATGTAVAGLYQNNGFASGISPLATPRGPLSLSQAMANATSNSSYFGVDQRITIQTFTNDVELDVGGRVRVLQGRPVTWRYVVTNTGNAPLSQVSVVDNVIGAVPCPSVPVSFATGAVFTCTAVNSNPGAVRDNYDNVGTAFGISPLGDPAGRVTSTDPMAYFGVHQNITLLKTTNGIDTVGQGALSPFVVFNSVVTWRYIISNHGNTALSTISVTDNMLGSAVSPCTTTLAAGGVATCTATGLAVSGFYTNTGAVTGSSPAPNSPAVSATYPSSYFGVVQTLSIVKYTNDFPVGSNPSIYYLNPVTWKYAVTNIGNTVLSSVTVTDNRFAGTASCPLDTLAVSQTMTCSATGQATSAAYTNVGTARGISRLAEPPLAQPVAAVVTATAPSQYTGILPTVSIAKFTNGLPLSPRPFLRVQDPVTWTYAITNTNAQPMTGIQVTDNRVSGPIACPDTQLAPSATFTCTATGTVSAGTYNNVGSVTGAVGPANATSTSPAGYFGVNASVTITKFTNGVNTLVASQRQVLINDPVTWRYVVTNTGNSDLSAFALSDSDSSLSVVCPPSLNVIAAGASFTCAVTGFAVANQYNNTGFVTALSPLAASLGGAAARVDSNHNSSYLGVSPSISLVKITNDVDVATENDAVGAESGTVVTWKYIVTNTGNFPLSTVRIVDDPQGLIACPTALLGRGEVVTCTATALVPPGSTTVYHNTATVTAAAIGRSVSAFDESWYNPTVLSIIQLRKFTNGVSTATDPPPRLRVGYPVTWTYEVSNVGSLTLSNILVTDDVETSVTCPNQPTLLPGAIMTCAATGVAIDCAYSNIGSVTGSRGTRDVSASAYIGILPIVSIQKFTNDFEHYFAASGAINSAYPPFRGPCIETGTPVTWHYVVSNVGDDLLTNIVVEDDQLGAFPACNVASLEPWYSVTCNVVGTAIDGQYHNIATVRATPAVGGDVITARDENWYIGLNPQVKVTLMVNGQSYYDPACDICELRTLAKGSSSSSSEGEGETGEGHSKGGKKGGRWINRFTGVHPPGYSEGGEGSSEGEGESSSEGSSGSKGHHHSPRSNCTLFNPRNRLIGDIDDRTINEGGVLTEGQRAGKQHTKAVGEAENPNPRVIRPLADVPLKATTKHAADKPKPAGGAEVLSAGEGEGESSSSGSVHYRTPVAPPPACNLASVPVVNVGHPVKFSFVVENIGSEWLTNVYMSLDPLCQLFETTGEGDSSSSGSNNSTSSGEGEGESHSVHTKAVSGSPSEAARTPAPAAVAVATVTPIAAPKLATAPPTNTLLKRTTPLSAGEGEGESGKKGKKGKGVRHTRSAEEGLGEGVRTNNIVCPTMFLGPGRTMVCNITRYVTVQEFGLQQLGITVQGFGYCTGKCLKAWSSSQWYTPLPPSPAPVSSSTGGAHGGSKGGKGESKQPRKPGCSMYFWRSSRATPFFPASAPSTTPFATALSLTTDPTAGLTLGDVLWSRGYDAASKFFRTYAAALLNARAVTGYALTPAQVTTSFNEAWARYQAKPGKTYLLDEAVDNINKLAVTCPFAS